MDVSIIIVNWNTRDVLHDCVASIYTQAKGIEFEVLVIDNASNDGSVEMVKKKFPQVILIENTENRGFAAANNQGIAIAEGRYVLLLNSDTVILNNAISKTVSFAESHPEAASLGCRVLNPDRSLQPTCFMFPSILNMLLATTFLYKLFPKSKFFGRERMTWWHRDNVKEVDVVTGCFVLVRREAIEQIGLMDEQFFMYAEETDWCYRFKQAGWKILFTPGTEIIHLGGQSSKGIRVDMLIRLRISILQFMKKHYSWLTYRIACFFVIVFFVTRLPVWICIALFSNKKRGEARNRVKAYTIGIRKALVSLHLF